MIKPWFKKRRYGWAPANWHGWLLIIGYLWGALIIAADIIIHDDQNSTFELWLMLITLTLLFFIIFFQKKAK